MVSAVHSDVRANYNLYFLPNAFDWVRLVVGGGGGGGGGLASITLHFTLTLGLWKPLYVMTSNDGFYGTTANTPFLSKILELLFVNCYVFMVAWVGGAEMQ